MALSEIRKALIDLAAPDIQASPAGRLVVDVGVGDDVQRIRITEDDSGVRLARRLVEADTLQIRVGDLLARVLSFNREQEFFALGRGEGWVILRVDLPPSVSVGEITSWLRRLTTGVAELREWLT